MKKVKIQNVKTLFDKGGKLNYSKLLLALNSYIEQEESGHYTSDVHMAQVTLPNGDIRIEVEITRHEVNKADPAYEFLPELPMPV